MMVMFVALFFLVEMFCCRPRYPACTYLSHLPCVSLGCFVFCLVKVMSVNFQDHFSSLWLYYHYSVKYLARVANAGADRKLKNRTTKAILHGAFSQQDSFSWAHILPFS